MRRQTLIAWWLVLGGALWLSSRVVASHPAKLEIKRRRR